MTKQELIEFGQKLIVKGRTPSEIHNAISVKAANKKQLNDVLEQVFINEKPTTKRNSERTKTLLDANKLKLNFEYSIKGLFKISFAVLVIGAVTYGLSKEEVNQNAIFGWMTLSQGIVIAILFVLIKRKRMMNLLLPAVIIYFSFWLIEFLIWGIPNDLLDAYNNIKLNTPPNFRLKSNSGGARMIGFMFPFLYISLKLLLGWFIFVAYRNQYRYDALSQDIKDDLKDF